MFKSAVNRFLQGCFDWSEVWALLIPICMIVVFRRRQPAFLKPVIVYLWVAFCVNLCADVVADFKSHLPSYLQSNNPLYNIHSLLMLVCFTYFFVLLKKIAAVWFNIFIFAIAVVFIIVNFSQYENFFNAYNLSGSLLAVSAYVLLIYCVQYYLFQLQHDVEILSSEKDFWIVTGLSIYVVINFFLFLFYVPMMTENPRLADRIWDIHNAAYIMFCILIAKALYVPVNNQS
jgi:hypothetical protein